MRSCPTVVVGSIRDDMDVIHYVFMILSLQCAQIKALGLMAPSKARYWQD